MPAGPSLVAVGGYGRGELFPHSDVDVLVLLPGDGTQGLERMRQATERFITDCWDAGLEIGSSVRTVEECVAIAASDVTVQTALLESRFLGGDRKVFAAFQKATAKAMDAKAFLRAKTLEMRQRHQKYENTPYSLEPNCKESPGGLRDLQTVIWVARAAGLGRTWQQLAAHGLITPFEVRQLQRNEGVLKLIRARLHMIAGRREDRLVFDLQTAVAESFGYMPAHGQRASERLMRRYYWAAKAVTQLNQILMLNIEERVNGLQDAPMRPINDKFLERGGMLEVASDDLYQRDPHAILETFLVYQQTVGPKGLSARTLRALYNARHLMDGKFRRDPVNHATFMKILQANAGQTHAFRLMNQTSVLGRYLWVFRRIVGQMQHDLFHVYTVDQHILMVLRNVRRFLIPEHAHEYPFCSQLASTFDRPWVLFIAALFHDVAKGRGGDHSVLGEREARRFCREHGVEREDTQLIEFLVGQHLTMSRIAQKEDLSDPDVIAAFAELIGTERRLTALYLLTVADIRGTSPKVWNAWKGKLLEDLYRLTLRALGGARPNLDAEIEATKLEARLLLNLASLPGTAEVPLWRTLRAQLLRPPRGRRDRLAHPLAARPGRHARRRWCAPGSARSAKGCRCWSTRPTGRTCSRAPAATSTAPTSTSSTPRSTPRPTGYALDTFLVVSPHFDTHYRDLIAYVETQLDAGAEGDRAAARAEPRPALAPGPVVPGDAAGDAAARRAGPALAARRLGERPLRPALRDLAGAGQPQHQPAARQDHDPGRAGRGHLPDRRLGAAAEQAAAADRDRDARRDQRLSEPGRSGAADPDHRSRTRCSGSMPSAPSSMRAPRASSRSTACPAP